MPQTARLKQSAAFESALPPSDSALAPAQLGAGETEEVLAFLSGGSVDSIFMSGLIRDNGMVSPLNRGTFCAVRDSQGALEGVALVGHATLVEARTERALAAFAELAKRCHTAHVIVGEQSRAEEFWALYRDGGQEPRRVCRELLFEQRWPVPVFEAVEDLRLATEDDVEHVMIVNAELAEAESGIDPRRADPEGFRRRTLRRIRQGRVWVLTDGDRLLFKADVMAETPEFTYLEGIWVNPDERRKGLGRRCLSQLGQTLLGQAGAVCLLVNELNTAARSFFQKSGYSLRGCYDTIFLRRV